MRARAGILRLLAARARGDVESELCKSGLRLRSGLDLHDDGKVVSFRQGFIREERSVGLRERQLDRCRAISRGDGDDFSGCGNRFSVFADEGDLDFAVGRYQKLRVRLGRGEQSSPVRAGLDVFVGLERDRGEDDGREDGDVFHVFGFVGCAG